MVDVVAVGELLIDFTCISQDDQGYPTIQAHPGGAPCNFLSALSKFNIRTAFIGKVGNDTFGRKLKDTLNEYNINTSGLVMDDNVFTTLAFVTLDSDGNREFSFARKPGADTCLKYDEVNLKLIGDAKVFHFGTLSLTNEPSRTTTYKLVDYAKKNNKIITYDPNLRKPLWKNLTEAKEQILWGLSKADILKISDDEVKFLFDLTPLKGAEYILNNYNVKLIFVTCGKDGAYFMNKNTFGHVDGLNNLKVIDTTGAGDIFGGSALYKILDKNKNIEDLNYEDLYEITRFACVSASLSTTLTGGLTSVFDLKEILNNL